MTAVLDTTSLLYDSVVGEPLPRTAPPAPSLNTTHAMWIVGAWDAVFPTWSPLPAPDLQRMVARMREWTGWSRRQLAEAVQTSHTTVGAIENGRRLIPGHSGNLRRRITDAYEVIERIFVLADRDPDSVTRLLESAADGERSCLDELRAGEPARAYLAAIDAHRPRQSGLLVAQYSRLPDSTSPLHD